jgi:DNA polymerase (family 10)
MTNRQLSQLLKRISAAYLILGENTFKTIAYDKAAQSIEHLTSEVKDYWREGKLDEIPGIGKTIAEHIDELFKTGEVKHFKEILAKIPESVFPLLLVPGIGPKKAYRLVTAFHLTNPETVYKDLRRIISQHQIASLEGFGEKSQQAILDGLNLYEKGSIKERRITLPEADSIAKEIVAHLYKHKAVKRVDLLGSLRRQASTIGDIDIALVTDKPDDVVKHFVKFPHERIIDQGIKGATIILHNGKQVDLRLQDEKSYGAMLQYFTGSKHHNIHLRSFALEQNLSLSEHGIKDIKTGMIREYADEKDFYHAIGLEWIPPELREDRGEIEASINKQLPALVQLQDIKGDLHMHTSYAFPTSHDLGQSHLHEHLDMAVSLGYDYIGVADHNPKTNGMSAKDIAKIMQARYEWYKTEYNKWQSRQLSAVNCELYVLCEVDILSDGRLAFPQEAFAFVDAVIVSLHSSFRQSRSDMTKRIINALTSHPKVRIYAHPTGRLLLKREGVDANWEEVMKVAKEYDIAMEINAYPDRLDLPDHLVFDAVERGIKLCIDTDSHHVEQMRFMQYGVSVARRGWAEKTDIINTNPQDTFRLWLLRK